ncbi:hypothetical protein V6N13_083934 [Hibiscus sabdariffa]
MNAKLSLLSGFAAYLPASSLFTLHLLLRLLYISIPNFPDSRAFEFGSAGLNPVSILSARKQLFAISGEEFVY